MRQKHDWDGLVREWITEKTAQPTLDMASFFRRHGFTTETQLAKARRRIGLAMGTAYAVVRDRALQQTQELASSELSKTLHQMLRLRRTQIAIGMQKITAQKGGKTDSEGTPIPEFEPTDFEGAEAAVDHGVRGITDIVRLITGGEPLVTQEARRVVFDFVPVARYNKPEPKKVKRKGGK